MDDACDLIIAAALIDTVYFPGGGSEKNICGGAGLYALAGAALFSDAPLLVTGTGADYGESFGPWLQRNGLGTRGLRIADPHTPRNILRYVSEGSRTETPVYGAEHFRRIEPQAVDVARVAGPVRSAYVFRNTDALFWDELARLREQRPFFLLWEIALDACSPAERATIERRLADVDAVSLNLQEAGLIFNSRDEAELVARLVEWPVRHVFLRAGGRGSHAISHGTAQFVPSLKTAVVDVTGGGNAYSGGALVGLAEGRTTLEAAIMGTVAASVAIAQTGLPEPCAPVVRAEARQRAAILFGELDKEALA